VRRGRLSAWHREGEHTLVFTDLYIKKQERASHMCICVHVASHTNRNRVGGSTGVGRASANLTSRNYVAPAPEPLRTYIQAHTLTLEAEDQSAAA